MVKSKRLYFRDVEKYDAAHGTHNIREIEMIVDSALTTYDPAYAMQFFADFRLYGLKEAMMYLENYVSRTGRTTAAYQQCFAELGQYRIRLQSVIG